MLPGSGEGDHGKRETVLRKEHKGILKMLDVTDEVARRLEAGQSVAPEKLADLLEFFRLFADQCHHGKEEDLLFPRLEQRGMPRAGGPIGVMLAEHDQGRSLIKQMAEASEAYGAGAPGVGAAVGRGGARLLCLVARPHRQGKQRPVCDGRADALAGGTR